MYSMSKEINYYYYYYKVQCKISLCFSLMELQLVL